MPQQAKPDKTATRGPARLSAADYAVRGIIVGGSLGAFGAMLGFSRSLFLGVGLGMIAGLLAGLTLAKKRAGRRREE